MTHARPCTVSHVPPATLLHGYGNELKKGEKEEITRGGHHVQLSH